MFYVSNNIFYSNNSYHLRSIEKDRSRIGMHDLRKDITLSLKMGILYAFVKSHRKKYLILSEVLWNQIVFKF